MPFRPISRFPVPGCGPSCTGRRTGGFTLPELLVVLVILAALAALVVANIDRTGEQAEHTAATADLHTVRDAITGTAAAPGYVSDMRYVPAFNPAAIRIHDLLLGDSHPLFSSFDPVTSRGWNGPYIRSPRRVENTNPARAGRFPGPHDLRFPGDTSFLDRGFFSDPSVSPYGQPGDLAIADAWGNPIVLQIPPVTAFSSPTDSRNLFRHARVVSAGPDGVLSTPRDRLAGRLHNGTATARGDDLVLFLNRADVYEPEEP